MTAFSEKEVLSVVEEVLSLEEGSRSDFVNERCAGSDELKRRVEELLAVSEETSPLPQFLVPRRNGGMASETTPTIAEPLRIASTHGDEADSVGPFRLLEVLGEGGMGVVYLAEQLRPKRRVAVKVIHPRILNSESSLHRFEREVELLGRLDHPGIARIYDAGAAMVRGRSVPFIAMEYVNGVSPREYVKRVRPSLTEKLTLIAKLADAVHSAHQKAVVHRDLKPANILITKNGEPKVLDFGIAASTEVDVERAYKTEAGDLLGTFAYMSPEQARGDVGAIDARSDIYTLGLIAYEVLIGQPAFKVSGARLDELVRGLERGEPKALGRVDSTLRGDVEAIIGMACREDPAARYDSASALATDIRSFLKHRPISARPLSATYELMKFVRRNRLVVGGAALLSLSLFASTVVATSMYKKASQNEALAVDRADDLKRVVKFQSQRLSGIDVAGMARDIRDGLIEKVRDASSATLGESDLKRRSDQFKQLLAGADLTALSLDVLNAHIFQPALLKIYSDFRDRPLEQATLLQTLATTFRTLGLLDEAVIPQAQALDIRSAEMRASQPEVLDSKTQMGRLLVELGQPGKARQQFEEVLEMRQQVLGEEHMATFTATNNLALTLADLEDYAGARELQEKMLETVVRVLGEEDPFTLKVMHNLATSLGAQGEHRQAQKLQERVLDVKRRVLEHDHPATLNTMNNLAQTLAAQGDHAGARGLQTKVLDARVRALGGKHPDTLIAMWNLAKTLVELDDKEQALGLAKQMVVGAKKTWGEEHRSTKSLVAFLKRLER